MPLVESPHRGQAKSIWVNDLPLKSRRESGGNTGGDRGECGENQEGSVIDLKSRIVDFYLLSALLGLVSVIGILSESPES